MNMKINVSWQNVEEYIKKVSEKYCDMEISGVYGIPRGGLILAVLISHKLNIPLLLAPTDNCIIVDDICDSGESLLHFYKNSSGNKANKYHITTMFYKENKLVKPEFYMYEKEDKWIVYPWEVD